MQIPLKEGGSRLLGYAEDDSEYDFYCQATDLVYQTLVGGGMTKKQRSVKYDLDFNTYCILMEILPCGRELQIQLVYDVQMNDYCYRKLMINPTLFELHKLKSRNRAYSQRALIWHTLNNMYLLTNGKEARSEVVR